MPPVAVVRSSLPDMGRPAMARASGSGDPGRAFQVVKEFRTAAAAVLAGTILIAAAVLLWFPSTILKQGYDACSAALVPAAWAAIMAICAMTAGIFARVGRWKRVHA